MKRDLNSMFILYVEDDESNRTVIRLMMERALRLNNFVIFENSQNFMERLRSLPLPPSIVMLDIHVAPYNGFEMLRMIRNDLNYSATKVIAVTASVMNEEIQKLRDSGFDGAIGKPLMLSAFPSLLQKIADGNSVWSIT